MDKELVEKTEVEVDNDDLGISSAEDEAFENLANAAQTAHAMRKRFVLACDATSSMGSWWQEAQKALKQAVDEISSRTNVPFQVKVVAYRDHLEDSVFVEESDWSSNTDYLKEFISSIRSHGGGDFPESIGHGLQPAVQSGASLVVLIGDAPGKQGSDGYKQAQQLGDQRCPVYALYVDDHKDTVSAFKRIAALSGGKAMFLQDAKSMTDIFAALLAKVVFQIEYQATSIEAKELTK